MPHSKFRSLSITALEGTPIVIRRLVHGAAVEEYDITPNPERFTIRGVLAHLADFDAIFLERMRRCRDEEEPRLTPRDEAQMAIDNDYAHVDPVASLARFSAARSELVAFLRNLPREEWQRTGIHAVAGAITIDEIVDLVVAHDGYHTRQIAEWLAV